ncbi:MAG: DNA alkylation repair protein [Kiritimatiellae bacterium]|nr:DNA alkylation repair protein [Kiritimatiellia bacterium]
MQRALRRLGSPKKAAFLQTFFKTGPGEYGAGDIFLGVTVPDARKLAREHLDLPLPSLLRLLRSPVHEERLVALLILVERFRKGDEAERKRIYDLYLGNTHYINNWDLVDLSVEYIVGPWLFSRSRKPLYRLARSRSLWERRIAIVATYDFIRQGQFDDTLCIARILLNDAEDLIHKATGWMLREVGKRDRAVLERFLDREAARMPRTALRYALERFPVRLKRKYMRKS